MSMLSSAMANSQQFCLKWNNHSANLIKTLTEMVADECFVDVTLACEGTSLKAHKMVLSACSNYFKELFKENPCQHPIVILKDMKIEDLKAIVDFMYKGEVNVSQNQLGALLKTAEVLKVKGLTEVGDESEKSGEKRNAGHLDETSGHMPAANQASAVNATGRKKKKRRTKKPNQQTSSPDDASGSESGQSSEDEETVDMSAVKRVKESNHSSTSQHQPQHSQSIPESLSNVMQTRRRTQQMPQLQQQVNQVQNQLPLQQRETVENSNDCHPDDSSEGWNQEQLGLVGRPEDDESDEMIDVKPIVSFDEGSMSSVGVPSTTNSSGIAPECMDVALMSPNTPVTTPGKICVCHLCHLTFTAYSSLRRHMQRHYADRERYECDICLKSYSRKDYLKEHKKLKHAVGFEIRALSATSAVTPQNTTTSITLAQTLAQIDQGLLPRGFGKCPICHKSLFHLKRHMNEVHLGVVYKCHLCGRRFKRTDKLNTHMSHAHSM